MIPLLNPSYPVLYVLFRQPLTRLLQAAWWLIINIYNYLGPECPYH